MAGYLFLYGIGYGFLALLTVACSLEYVIHATKSEASEDGVTLGFQDGHLPHHNLG